MYHMKMHAKNALYAYANIVSDFGLRAVQELTGYRYEIFAQVMPGVDTDYKVDNGFYNNDTSVYLTEACQNTYLGERLLYLSNQTEWYHAVSSVIFTLDPWEQEIIQLQKISAYVNAPLEDTLMILMFVGVFFYLVIMPINRMINESQRLSQLCNDLYKVDSYT